MVSASTSRAVDLDLISSRIIPMTLKLLFTASLVESVGSATKGQCGEQTGTFICCAVGKNT